MRIARYSVAGLINILAQRAEDVQPASVVERFIPAYEPIFTYQQTLYLAINALLAFLISITA